MSTDNEIYQDDELEQENIETANSDEDSDEQDSDDELNELETLKLKLKNAEAENTKFKAILDRKRKNEGKKPQPLTNTNQSVEEVVLRANGTSKEEIEMLKKIANVNGTSILEAKTDPLFTTWKQKLEADAKAEEAGLGVSRRSAPKHKAIDFATPGLSDSQFKELLNQHFKK